ncbi:peroxisomal acyl-coenzyme A oxidase 1.2 [Physcia stellaris]|nr:peroxisomal acyl-coenzyme A oxidase 1.2 [Physcia stellaris]
MATQNRQKALMELARGSASFSSRELTYLLYEGKEATERREAAFTRVENALGLSDTMKLPSVYANQDREGYYLDGLAFGKAIMDDEIQHRHGVFDYHTHRYALIISSPFGHNPTMFGATLKLQTSPEQRKYWMPLVESGKIIGTYAQTELGHGTYLRGLETTATLDLDTDEFIIHSPTLTSTKYWPSALGFSASHAIVMANLIIKERNYGMQPFIVQLRSLDDFSLMPGVETGDIGLKMGFNSSDMGYAVFTNLRIPRTHLLMGNVQVHRDGTFVEGKHQKLAYATMMYTRDRIVHAMVYRFAQAVVIATRYSTVREQGIGFSPTSTAEWPIMAYKSQHYRLLSLMAQAYALFFAAKECTTIYNTLTARQIADDHSFLPYVHATTAALKAYATQIAYDGADEARKCCGGYGYSVLSGFPSIVGDLAPMPTLEGENYVIRPPRRRGHLLPRLRSLPYPPSSSASDFLTPETQLAAFRHRATRLAFRAHHLLAAAQATMPYAQAWNTHMLPLVHAARAHIELFVLSAFIAHTSPPDPAIRTVLHRLRSLFALTAIENPLSHGSLHFVEDGYLSLPQLEGIRELVGDFWGSWGLRLWRWGTRGGFRMLVLGARLGVGMGMFMRG